MLQVPGFLVPKQLMCVLPDPRNDPQGTVGVEYGQSLALHMQWDVPTSAVGLLIVQDRVGVKEREKGAGQGPRVVDWPSLYPMWQYKNSKFRLTFLDYCEGLFLKVGEQNICYLSVRLFYDFQIFDILYIGLRIYSCPSLTMLMGSLDIAINAQETGFNDLLFVKNSFQLFFLRASLLSPSLPELFHLQCASLPDLMRAGQLFRPLVWSLPLSSLCMLSNSLHIFVSLISKPKYTLSSCSKISSTGEICMRAGYILRGLGWPFTSKLLRSLFLTTYGMTALCIKRKRKKIKVLIKKANSLC